MTTPSADDYRHAMARHPRLELPALPGRRNHLRTGVLVPLVWRGDDVDCVLTVRSRQLRTHGGEVSFPGGRPEGDESLDATALREAREELGIAEAEILGELSSVPLYTSDFRLFPFVAAIADAPLTPSPDEVAEVLTVSLGELLARDHFDAIAWDLGGRLGSIEWEVALSSSPRKPHDWSHPGAAAGEGRHSSPRRGEVGRGAVLGRRHLSCRRCRAPLPNPPPCGGREIPPEHIAVKGRI
jgi:8-oxo-dGTP pyrophosphatase MutT (NUDIX family)